MRWWRKTKPDPIVEPAPPPEVRIFVRKIKADPEEWFWELRGTGWLFYDGRAPSRNEAITAARRAKTNHETYCTTSFEEIK